MGGKKMSKRNVLIPIVSVAFMVMAGMSAFAQYPTPPADYVEKSLYSPAVYAKVQDWVRCSITNYFPDSPLYAQVYIYDQNGAVVWPTDPNTVYEVASWSVAWERYQVQTEGHYWCEVKVKKSSDQKYLGWGRAAYSYEPAGLGYEPVYVAPSPAD
jgi:hypothetical protein